MKVSSRVNCLLVILTLFVYINGTESVFGNYGFGSFHVRTPGPMFPYFNPQAMMPLPPRIYGSNKDAEWLPHHHPSPNHHPHHHQEEGDHDSSYEDDDEDNHFDNNSCPGGWGGSTRWPCVPTKDCTTLKPRTFRAYCGWTAGSPLVCCPPEDKQAIHADVKPTTVPPRNKKPTTVPPRNNRPPAVPPRNNKPQQVEPQTCGRLVSDSTSAIVFRDGSSIAPASIVGGIPLRTAQSSPWMAAIGERSKNETEWFCGGSLIATQWVITAAHCTTIRKAEIVRLGELDFSRTDEPASPKDFLVVKIEMHPEYNPPMYYHDIALLKIREPATFNKYIQPICLSPPRMKSLDGALATVAGWGYTEFGGENSDVLQEVGVPIIPNDRCTKSYSASRTIAALNYPRGITSDLLCAGDTDKGGRDACRGDSGGPLVMREGNVYNLIGVVSSGVGCGSRNYPGVYVRISNYTEWIKNVIR